MSSPGLFASLLLLTGSKVAEYVDAVEWSLNENAGHFPYRSPDSEWFVKAAILSVCEIEFSRADGERAS